MAQKTFLVDINLNKNQLLNPVYQNLATDPANPVEGQFIYNSADHKPKYFNGTSWVYYDKTLTELGGQPLIAAGTTSQYFRGDKTWQTLNTTAVVEGTNLYYTDTRVKNLVGTYTGDLSTSSGTTFTLKTVNSNTGTYGTSTSIPVFVVNGKGLITSVSNQNIGILNQNTTGSAGSLLNTHTIFGQNFNGTQNVAGVANVSGIKISNGTNEVNLSVDASGNLMVDNNLYSTGSVSAYGLGGTGSTGGGLIETVYGISDLSGTYLDSDLSETFNAYTIKSLHNRIGELESGSATDINVTGSGNAITSITKSGTTITATRGSTFLTGNQNISVTGDATGNGNTGIALTLATVNSNIGSFGSSTAIPSITVNGKGLVTGVSTSAVVAPAGTLTGTALASGVVSSSLTTVGTIGTGTWQGSLISPTYGGTGVNNGSKLITLGGNLTTSGAFNTTLTTTAATTVTLPTSGTLFSDKTSSITSAQLLGALSDETGTGVNVFGTSPTITTSIIAGSASMDIFNTVATTVNAFGAASSLNIGVAAGTTTIKSNLIVSGNLTINGTTTTINATTLQVDDKNIELGSVTGATDTTADGGGITLKGATDKTFNWINSTDSWTSSENIDLTSGKSFKIAGSDVLSVSSSNTTVGGTNGIVINNTNKTITSGVWNGSVIGVAYGGTGYNSGVITRKVTGTITGGTTSFSVVHGFASGIVAQAFETSSGTVIDCEIVTATAGTTVFNFNVAPTSGTYSYCIIG